jgi:aspartate aminotransferase
MSFSENVRQVEGSATIAIEARARELRAQGRNVLDLSIGETDFRTPEFAAQAGITAIQEGHTHYPPVPGIAPLREAIGRLIQRTTGMKAEGAGVVVTSGAKQALFNACFCLFGPGDEVLIPVPYWTSYPALVRLEQDGFIKGEWGTSDNGRRARFYALTKRGTKALRDQIDEWVRMTSLIDGVLGVVR